MTSSIFEFGRLDYVVNAAGVAMKHQGGAAFAHIEDWQRIIDINLTGTFFVLRAAAKIMLKQEPIMSTIDADPCSVALLSTSAPSRQLLEPPCRPHIPNQSMES